MQGEKKLAWVGARSKLALSNPEGPMVRTAVLALTLLLLWPTASQSGVYDAYKDLTPAEKRLALRYFWQLPKVYRAAQHARDESASRYPQQSGQDDARDAYRHSLWNGSMVRRLRSERAAARWGTAHEEWQGNPAARKAMDLFNNARGRELTWARRTRSRVLFWTRTRLPDDGAIASMLRAELAAGGLVEIEAQGGVRDPHQGTLVPTRTP
jgi:hypothetical protein